MISLTQTTNTSMDLPGPLAGYCQDVWATLSHRMSIHSAIRPAMLRFHNIFMPILVTIGILGCSESGPRTTERIGPDGVREVLTIAEPPYATPWILVEESSIGVAYGDSNYMLGDPRRFTVLDDGTCVILDTNPLQFMVYGADGRFIRNFAQQGRGPGDLNSSGYLLRSMGGDRVEHWSDWPLRRQIWDAEGHLLSVETMSQDHPLLSVGRPRWRGALGEGLFTFYTNYGQSYDEMRDLHLFWVSDWAGEQARQLFTVESFDWESLELLKTGVGMAQALHDFTPAERLLVTQSGRIYYSGLDEDWIRAFDPHTGAETMRFRLEHSPPMAISKEEVQEVRASYGKQIGDGMAWWSENYWLFDIIEGPQEEVWVQRTSKPDAAGHWPTDVFSVDGVHRGRLFLPFPPFRMRLHAGKAYVLAEGGQGEPVLRRYSLVPH